MNVSSGVRYATYTAGLIALANVTALSTNPLTTICAIGLYIGVMIVALRNVSAPVESDTPTPTSTNISSPEAKVETLSTDVADIAGTVRWETYPKIPDPQPEKSDPAPTSRPNPHYRTTLEKQAASKLRSRSSLEPSMVGKSLGYVPVKNHDHEWASIRTLGDSHDRGFCVECFRQRYPL